MDSQKPRVGVSACLLGQRVRYDGGHKRDDFILRALRGVFEWVPVCPEVELGLGTPREALRLVGGPAAPRLLAAHTGRDHTAAMRRYAARRVESLRRRPLDGYILKSGSPSCGLERVKVHAGGRVVKGGTGLFARALRDGMTSLPMEEETGLRDPVRRESFVARVFAHHRWRALREGRGPAKALPAFHARHKYLLMSRGVASWRALERLAAARRVRAYGARFLKLLERPAARRDRGLPSRAGDSGRPPLPVAPGEQVSRRSCPNGLPAPGRKLPVRRVR